MDNRSNTLARYWLLKKALQGGKQIPASLRLSCKSQGGLAKLHIPSEGIEPVSLNTLKANANEAIEDGGWDALDAMRKAYLKAAIPGDGAAKKSASTSRTKRQKDKLIEAEQALEMERRYLIRLQVAYDALLAHMRTMVRTDPDVAHFINRHVTGFSFKWLAIANGEGNASGE